MRTTKRLKAQMHKESFKPKNAPSVAKYIDLVSKKLVSCTYRMHKVKTYFNTKYVFSKSFVFKIFKNRLLIKYMSQCSDLKFSMLLHMSQ